VLCGNTHGRWALPRFPSPVVGTSCGLRDGIVVTAQHSTARSGRGRWPSSATPRTASAAGCSPRLSAAISGPRLPRRGGAGRRRRDPRLGHRAQRRPHEALVVRHARRNRLSAPGTPARCRAALARRRCGRRPGRSRRRAAPRTEAGGRPPRPVDRAAYFLSCGTGATTSGGHRAAVRRRSWCGPGVPRWGGAAVAWSVAMLGVRSPPRRRRRDRVHRRRPTRPHRRPSARTRARRVNLIVTGSSRHLYEQGCSAIAWRNVAVGYAPRSRSGATSGRAMSPRSPSTS
jgi:hypothetical protein